GRSDPPAAKLRELPAVHELAATLNAPHSLAVTAARQAIEEQRAAMLAGAEIGHHDLRERASVLASELERPSLRRVINATGVIVHTNLGRGPLAEAAREALEEAASGY